MTIPNEKYLDLVESSSELSDHEFALFVAEQLTARSWKPSDNPLVRGKIDTLQIEELIEQVRFYMLDFYGVETKNR